MPRQPIDGANGGSWFVMQFPAGFRPSQGWFPKLNPWINNWGGGGDGYF